MTLWHKISPGKAATLSGRICFEDGCEQTIVEFWAARRNQTGWTDGWSVFNEAK
jgi:hypothetical protein